MNIRSMTGYGSYSERLDGWQVDVECWSVNRDRLDVRPRLPDGFVWLKPEITKTVEERLHRGRIQVTVEIEPVKGEGATDEAFIDDDKFQKVCRRLRQLAETTATEPVTLSDVLVFKEEFELDKLEAFTGQKEDIVAVVESAIDELVESRRREGQNLGDKIDDLLDELKGALSHLKNIWPEAEQRYRESLKQRLQEVIEEFELGDMELSRFGEQLVYYADKRDVSEEVQRLESHLEKIREELFEANTKDEARGKTIDFYLQEMVRETNTMSSKVDRPELTDVVIECKSIVEKLREQAANIE